MPTEQVQLTLRLPAALHADAVGKALLHDKSLNALIVEALAAEVRNLSVTPVPSDAAIGRYEARIRFEIHHNDPDPAARHLVDGMGHMLDLSGAKDIHTHVDRLAPMD